MITIGNEHRVINWDVIHAEYIGGGISQRKLADKYGISRSMLMMKANRDGWKEDRDRVQAKARAKTEQKAIDSIASNAERVARIKTKLLIRLEKEIDNMPEDIGSESRQTDINKSKTKIKESSRAYKLRDFTSALRDLTDETMNPNDSDNELLRSLLEIERGKRS